jgi:hypothetical protein
VKSLEVATYAPAEFRSADIRHIPISDNHSRLVFREQIKGCASILRKQ